MNKRTPPLSEATINPRELILASLIVAIGLAALAFGYWEGRHLGSMLIT